MSIAAVTHTGPSPAPVLRIGTLVAVVGPSGAGKDSVINAARLRFAMAEDVVFARRVITRPAEINEPHEPVTEALFRRGIVNGDFAMWWQANGLLYGLPAEIHDDIAAGRIVIANLSRERAAEARQVFHRCTVVHVTARPEILASRLALRGRETSLEQIARLNRAQALEASVKAEVLIANDGALDEAVNTFETAINQLRHRHRP